MRLPVPGPVPGILLNAAPMICGEVPMTLRNTANGLLQPLSLLFVSAGAGVMTHPGLLTTA